MSETTETTNVRDSNTVFTGQVDAGQSTPPTVPVPGVQTQTTPPTSEWGYEIPIDTIPLPSRGLVYPEGSALHGRSDIEIRAMTAKDEDILTSRALIKKGTVISHLLRSCIVDKSINVDDMLLADRQVVMIALRITSYGPEYAVEVQCPACDEKEVTTFDLSQLPIKWLEVQPTAPGQNVFAFQLPMSRVNIQFRFLTGRDEIEMSRDMEARKKKLKTSFDNVITSQLQRLIVSVNGDTSKSTIARFVDNMPVHDSRVLREYITKIQPGMDMTQDFVCSSCGEMNEVEVPIGASFFWPDA